MTDLKFRAHPSLKKRARIMIVSGICLLNLALMGSAESTQQTTITDVQAYSIIKAARGSKVDPTHCHLDRNELFPGTVLINAFAYDRGDAPDALIVGEKYGELQELTPQALQAAGWKEKSMRTMLATEWAGWALVGRKPLTQAPEDFQDSKAPRFTAPEAHLLDDGGVETTFWVQGPTGMVPGRHFRQVRLVFTPTGEVKSVNNLASFDHKTDGQR